MADPNDNIATLQSYWAETANGTRNALDLAKAMAAMTELITQARGTPAVRQAFATASIFETALNSEPSTGTDDTIAAASNVEAVGGMFASILANADSDMRPPRQIMLDGIWGAVSGGWFSATDPSGVASWLNDPDVAGAGMVAAISKDPRSGARAAALRIIRDLAIPSSWAGQLTGANVFAILAEQLPRSPWSLGERIVIQALSEAAKARLATAAAQAAVGGLPMFGTGTGSEIEMLPSPKSTDGPSWGIVIAGSVLGVIGGAALSLRHKRRAQ